MSNARAAELLRRIEDRTARVVIIGQGYVGLPVALRAVEVGFPVLGFELDPRRVAALRSGTSYVEDVSDEQLARALATSYRPSDDPADLADFDIAVISVPTPLREGNPDLTFVEDATRTLAGVLRPGALVVLESTTYPGTTEELVRPILESGGLKVGADVFCGYSPERIDPGNPHYTFVSTPKVVSGSDEDSLACVDAFYRTLVDKTVPVGSTAEAELVKLLENTFRHVNIALINELAMFAYQLGVDIWNAVDAAATKPFGFMRFTPGPGVGGHCLPVDPSYLSWRVKRQVGRPFRFVELANDVNDAMPAYVVSRITRMLNAESRSVRGTRILLLGLTYKAGTSDARESPSMVVAERLHALGADLRICDPHVTSMLAPSVDAPLVPFDDAELAGAELVVVLVNHPEFDVDRIARASALVLDTKGILRERTFRGELL